MLLELSRNDGNVYGNYYLRLIFNEATIGSERDEQTWTVEYQVANHNDPHELLDKLIGACDILKTALKPHPDEIGVEEMVEGVE